MEKKFEERSHILQDDEELGMVKIADDVVAMIAGLAAAEVEGIHALSGNATYEVMSRVGVKGSKGVKVEVINKRVRVRLSVIVEYGYNIPVISQAAQKKVKMTIENMTGLEVTDVSIRIAGVNISKDR